MVEQLASLSWGIDSTEGNQLPLGRDVHVLGGGGTDRDLRTHGTCSNGITCSVVTEACGHGHVRYGGLWSQGPARME